MVLWYQIDNIFAGYRDEVETVRPLYDVVVEAAPDYDMDEIMTKVSHLWWWEYRFLIIVNMLIIYKYVPINIPDNHDRLISEANGVAKKYIFDVVYEDIILVDKQGFAH